MTRAFAAVLGVAIIMAASITSLTAADNGKQVGFGPNPQLPKPDHELGSNDQRCESGRLDDRRKTFSAI